MNANKLARIESGLNGMAKKVLEAVPMQSPWSKDQIAVELRRLGSSASRDVIDGCLNTLCERGAVKEPTRGNFIRVLARQPITTTQELDMPATIRPIATPAPVQPATADDTLSRLANLGALLRRAADEAEAIALDVEDRVKAAGKDGEKLRQLQALLKSISA
ncbi:hypothetical protein H4CHR_04407 [Variovorax sp. PBS-H4]|uniref:hypothetical protein n=1 Tax=Variovorax sp. PBS-H4 TaxID=434008 RepID=UPI0013176216|nr:hypothetical protein [Variovorax sp. PBS-H4]VTU38365.1 hypothetical protein H4CHR_04407 [Variovorax sp. PBS-H4]